MYRNDVKRLESTKLTESSVSDGDARSKTGITTSTGAASPRWRWRKAKRGELCEEPTFSFGRMGPLGIKLKRSAPPLSRPELRDHDTSCQVVASLQNSFAAASTQGKGPHLPRLPRSRLLPSVSSSRVGERQHSADQGEATECKSVQGMKDMQTFLHSQRRCPSYQRRGSDMARRPWDRGQGTWISHACACTGSLDCLIDGTAAEGQDGTEVARQYSLLSQGT
ncbi:hypothetical protein EV126DRAFT_10569 [Verticillium dahliae]|nr:hypothetical protein EV126DRAFT_10569 [Verticillium dahliae]